VKHAAALCDSNGEVHLCGYSSCEDGFIDANDDTRDGCETACTETNGGQEICDDLDNDCNGLVDDLPSAETPCNIPLDAPGPLSLFEPTTSPNNDETPTILVGGVTQGLSVGLYLDPACSPQQEVARGVATGLSVELSASALLEGQYVFYAKSARASGVSSACSSEFVNYELDLTAPGEPGPLSLFDPPSSPGHVPTPTLRVEGVEANDQVTLFLDAACTQAAGTQQSGSSSVDIVSDDLAEGSYDFYAQATDPSGNVSACSTSTVHYELDFTAPGEPGPLTLINPAASPGSLPTPTIQIEGVSSGDGVGLFIDAACTLEVGRGVASAISIELDSAPLPQDGIYEFHAQSRDVAGNLSACSTAKLIYELDRGAPSAPGPLSLVNPSSSPGSIDAPTIGVAGVSAGDQVSLFTDMACQNLIASGVAAMGSIELTTPALADGVYDFYAAATDPAGNLSACSTETVRYQLITTAPSMPLSVYLVDPTSSPGNLDTPTVGVSGVSLGETVTLYNDVFCLTQVASGSVSTGSAIEFTLGPIAAGTHRYYATSSNIVGSSGCSTSFALYVLDLTPPTVSIDTPAPQAEITESNAGNFQVTGSCSESGQDVVLSGDASATIPCVGGAWSATLNFVGNALGAVSVQADHQDAAGNLATPATRSLIYLPPDVAVESLCSGLAHSCAVSRGGVLCWGYDGPEGRLGDGGGSMSSTPVQVVGLPPGSGASQVSCGSYHSCALVNGGVKCWGAGLVGQLGDGALADSPFPVDVFGLGVHSAVHQIAVGQDFSCALVNGGVRCWGDGLNGQLGDGLSASSSLPVQVSGLPDASGVREIALGDTHACAVVGDGAKCWGSDFSGENGSLDGLRHASPVDVQGLLPGSGVTGIAAGGLSSCAIVDGGVKCWGDGSVGQLGDGGSANRAAPAPVAGLPVGGNVQAISLGNQGGCAIDNDALKCWGAGTAGQLGDGLLTSASTPVTVSGLGAGSATTQIAMGGAHACALSKGQVRCFGLNTTGQVGDGAALPGATPVASPAPVVGLQDSLGVSQLASGVAHSCALVRGGVKCWGDNASGQLGDASQVVRNRAAWVSGLGEGAGVTAIGAGGRISCAVQRGGLLCWGDNRNGRLGTGNFPDQWVPTQVVSLIEGSGVRSVAVGRQHSCAIQHTGAVCWGDLNFGALGDGNTTGSRVPVPMLGLTTGVWMISVGDTDNNGGHSCAIVGNQVQCWGRNDYFQLARGGQPWTVREPGVSMGLSGVAAIDISLGIVHSSVILGDGLSSFGGNSGGPLGTGNHIIRDNATGDSGYNSPVARLGYSLGAGIRQISTGGAQDKPASYDATASACLLIDDGVQCIGNAAGTPLPQGSGAEEVSLGHLHRCARVLGDVRCWGSSNSQGQLGDGSFVAHLAPEHVLGLY